jgi:hypothetical protein
MCPNGYADFPTFYLDINGHLFGMSPEDYIANEDDICVLLIYNLGNKVIIDEATVVLGVNFLRKYYTVFDLEKLRVGIYGNQIKAKTSAFEGILFFTLIGIFII